jgi:hypothetical protein
MINEQEPYATGVVDDLRRNPGVGTKRV